MKAPDLLNVYTMTPDGRACVDLRNIRRAGAAFTADVTYYRNGEAVGEGRWSGDGFAAPVPPLASGDAESAAAVSRLEREVRAAMSRYD